MGKTSISWCDRVWNPVRGCSMVSDGCRNCYAQRQAHRFNFPDGPYEGLTRMTSSGPVWNGNIKVVENHLDDPLHWQKPERIFVGSMSDLFHPRVPDSLVMRVWRTMRLTPRHTYLILTKRAERMRDWSLILNNDPPLPNVQLGVSVENQKMAEERIPMLLKTPAAVRWISAEPLLGPIDLSPYWMDRDRYGECGTLDWVVVGGESGPGHRPMKVEWLESIVEQCVFANVPVFVKQAAVRFPGTQGEIPDDLWAHKEFPEVATCKR